MSQPKKRNQVMTSRPDISPTQSTTEMMGNNGTKGTLNARLRSGWFLRRNITPSETRTKANKVPMFERSAAWPIATNPAGKPTTKPAIHVDQCGVLNLECSVENNLGHSPSGDMANQLRVCPY